MDLALVRSVNMNQSKLCITTLIVKTSIQCGMPLRLYYVVYLLLKIALNIK